MLGFSAPGLSDPRGSATAPPIPRCSPGSHRPQPHQVWTAPLVPASARTLTSLLRAVGSAWVEAQRCLAACDSLGGGGAGVEGGWVRGCREGSGGGAEREHRTPDSTRRSAGATGASCPEGDRLRCGCPGGCSEPRNRKDREAAASDRPPAMGGGFRWGSAAAVSELPGQHASPWGASRAPRPGRLPTLPFLLSPETRANRSAGWLISGTVLRAPVQGGHARI